MEPRKLEWARGEAAAPKTIKITISKELPVNLTTVDLTGDAFDYEPVTVKKGREYKIIVTPKSTARPAFNTIWVRTDSAGSAPRRFLADFSSMSFGIYLVHFVLVGAVYRLFGMLHLLFLPASLSIPLLTAATCLAAWGIIKLLSFLPGSRYLIG